MFTYPETVVTPELTAEDPIKVVVRAGHPVAGHGRTQLAAPRDERWVAGCVRCSEHLRRVCAEAGFAPDVRHTTDDYVVAQALVAEGLAATLLPELALRSYRHPDVAVLHAAIAGSRQLLVLHHREAVRTPAIAAAVSAFDRGPVRAGIAGAPVDGRRAGRAGQARMRGPAGRDEGWSCPTTIRLHYTSA